MKDSKPVLLVEDDVVDAMTVRRVFKELNITSELIHKVDGEDALEYLKGQGSKKPSVILLDLNMPKMDGIEFLRVAKGDVELKSIPVVVLTTSNADRDIIDSFKLGVAGYIVKPVDYKQFSEAMKVVEQYWSLSRLPSSNQ